MLDFWGQTNTGGAEKVLGLGPEVTVKAKRAQRRIGIEQAIPFILKFRTKATAPDYTIFISAPTAPLGRP